MRCFRTIGILAVLPALVLGLVASQGQGAAPLLTKGPYLQNPSTTAITVQYETSVAGDGAVAYGAGGTLDRRVPAQLHEKIEYLLNPSDKKSARQAAYLYRARLTNLAPGTVYQYQVLPTGSAAEGSSAVRTLRTFPDKAEPVTFIAYGDSRSYPDKHRAVASNFNEYRPAFILHNGDLVRSGSALDQWGPQFFAPLRDVIDHIPMMLAIGNHEGDPKNLLRWFDLPGGRTWYSFDYGVVHVVVLDNDIETREVLTWLDKDLAASKAPWKIVMYHYPTFNFAGHRTDANRGTFLPLLEKHGVDVVLAGHSHLYERFKPLVRTKAAPAPAAGAATASKSGTTISAPAVTAAVTAASAGIPRRPIMFVTLGGGGARLVDAVQHPLLAKAAKVYHFAVLAADAETLRYQAFTPDGREFDAFTLTKKGGRDDPVYLAQAQPMESAIFAQGVTRLAAPTVTAVPTKPDFTVTLKARFSRFTEPVTVAVRLADSSTAHYETEPMTVEAKPGKEATLALKIHARGSMTTEPDREDPRTVYLRPPLRFAFTIKATSFDQALESADVAYRKPEPAEPRASKSPSTIDNDVEWMRQMDR